MATAIYNDSGTTYDDITVAFNGAVPTDIIYKEFLLADQLSAFDLTIYVMNQALMTFPSAAQRASQIGEALTSGMVSFLEDQKYTSAFTGATWMRMAYQNDVAASDAQASLLSILVR